MLPLIREGDLLSIDSLEGRAPIVGSLILYEHASRLYLHRVMRMRSGPDGSTMIRTRGTAVSGPSLVIDSRSVMGVVFNIERPGRTVSACGPLWRLRGALHTRVMPIMRRFLARK